jgi:hypothetical protein
MVVAGCRDVSLRNGGRGLVSVASPGDHRRPRGLEGALPGRCLCVRNVETPPGSARRWTGRSADRKERPSPWREQRDQKANAGGRKAAGRRGESISAFLLMVVDNRPDIAPGARARKRADVVR